MNDEILNQRITTIPNLNIRTIRACSHFFDGYKGNATRTLLIKDLVGPSFESYKNAFKLKAILVPVEFQKIVDYLKMNNLSLTTISEVKLTVTDKDDIDPHLLNANLEEVIKDPIVLHIINSNIALSNIKTLKDLISFDSKELKAILSFTDYSRLAFYLIDNYHLFYEDAISEFQRAGLANDTAFVPVAILNISEPVKTGLIRNSVLFLGDIICLGYDKIADLNAIGQTKITELKKYINGLGFKFESGIVPDNATLRKQLKDSGIEMLSETLGIPAITCRGLTSKGIFTIDDLLAAGTEILDSAGISENTKDLILNAMMVRGYSFNKDNINSNLTKKEELLRSLASALKEKEKLDILMQEVDLKIATLQGELQALESENNPPNHRI